MAINQRTIRVRKEDRRWAKENRVEQQIKSEEYLKAVSRDTVRLSESFYQRTGVNL